MIARCVLGLTLALLSSPANASLDDARHAQALLGPETWTRIVELERRGDTASVYPRRLYALIFALADVLWFYTATDGTQSLSLRRGRLEADKADFAPLLREIDAGFGAPRLLAPPPWTEPPQRTLANGCFIESVAAARAQRGFAAEMRLLMYYHPARRQGHCILAYRGTDGIYLLDTAERSPARRVAVTWPEQALSLARHAVDVRLGPQLRSARYLPFALDPVPTHWAEHAALWSNRST